MRHRYLKLQLYVVQLLIWIQAIYKILKNKDGVLSLILLMIEQIAVSGIFILNTGFLQKIVSMRHKSVTFKKGNWFSVDFRGSGTIKSGVDSIFRKKVNVIGDSFVENHMQAIEKTWHYKLAVKYGWLYRNYGINGNGLIDGRLEGKPVVERIDEMDKDADLIFVVGGINDYNNQLPLADFKAGMDIMKKKLEKRYANCKIVLFPPWMIYEKDADDYKDIRLQEYLEIMRKLCIESNIIYFDTWKGPIKMWDHEFRTVYSQGTEDNKHLNTFGHDLFLKEIENKFDIIFGN